VTGTPVFPVFPAGYKKSAGLVSYKLLDNASDFCILAKLSLRVAMLFSFIVPDLPWISFSSGNFAVPRLAAMFIYLR